MEGPRHSQQLKALLGSTEHHDDDTGADVLPPFRACRACRACKSACHRKARRPDLFAVQAHRQCFAALRSLVPDNIRSVARHWKKLPTLLLDFLIVNDCAGFESQNAIGKSELRIENTAFGLPKPGVTDVAAEKRVGD